MIQIFILVVSNELIQQKHNYSHLQLSSFNEGIIFAKFI